MSRVIETVPNGKADYDDIEEFEQPARGEQREIGGIRQQCVPVESTLEEMHLAVRVLLRAGGCADRVAGLCDQQGLAPGDEVSAAQAAGEARRQGVRGGPHCAWRPRRWARGRRVAFDWLSMRGRLCRLDGSGSTR